MTWLKVGLGILVIGATACTAPEVDDVEPVGEATQEFKFKNKNGKGKLKFEKSDWSLDLQIANELAIREPSQCNGSAKAKVTWDKKKNEVRVRAKFKGLPYRPTYCYDDYLGNPGHTINPMPECVEHGNWQMWLIGRWGTVMTTWYYDTATGDILGNEYEFGPDGRFGPGPPPADATPVTVPAFHLICSEPFESNPHNLKANVDFTFAYDQMLDNEGTRGTFSTVIPTNLYDPSTLDLVAVVGGLPPEIAMNWDDVLDDIESGTGAFALYTSLEPDPKPDFLASRDNGMIGWATVFPSTAIVPPVPPSECGTYQLDNYFGFIPPPYRGAPIEQRILNDDRLRFPWAVASIGYQRELRLWHHRGYDCHCP